MSSYFLEILSTYLVYSWYRPIGLLIKGQYYQGGMDGGISPAQVQDICKFSIIAVNGNRNAFRLQCKQKHQIGSLFLPSEKPLSKEPYPSYTHTLETY